MRSTGETSSGFNSGSVRENFFTDEIAKFVVLSTKDHHRALYLFCITCLLCRWGDLLGDGGEGDVLGRVPEHQQLWPGEH